MLARWSRRGWRFVRGEVLVLPSRVLVLIFCLGLLTLPLFTRDPYVLRVVILSIGLLFAKGAGLGDFELLAPSVYVLAGLTLITTFQRIAHVRTRLNAALPLGAADRPEL